MEIAIAMEVPRSEVENVRVAGLLHDIGKIEISGEILRKAAELSTEERELIDTHPVRGAYILSAVGSVLKEVVPIVIAHHKYFVDALETSERDLRKIPLGARIVAVADSFDAMTSDRPYRKGKAALGSIRRACRSGREAVRSRSDYSVQTGRQRKAGKDVRVDTPPLRTTVTRFRLSPAFKVRIGGTEFYDFSKTG